MAVMSEHIDVPEQLMIATHANKGRAPTPPFPVLRMEFDPDEVAELHARKLLDAMAGKPHSEHTYVQPAVYEYEPAAVGT